MTRRLYGESSSNNYWMPWRWNEKNESIRQIFEYDNNGKELE